MLMLKSDWLMMFLSLISWKKRNEHDFNYIIHLYHYRYSCGVDFAVLLESERLIQLHGYSYCS